MRGSWEEGLPLILQSPPSCGDPSACPPVAAAGRGRVAGQREGCRAELRPTGNIGV